MARDILGAKVGRYRCVIGGQWNKERGTWSQPWLSGAMLAPGLLIVMRTEYAPTDYSALDSIPGLAYTE